MFNPFRGCSEQLFSHEAIAYNKVWNDQTYHWLISHQRQLASGFAHLYCTALVLSLLIFDLLVILLVLAPLDERNITLKVVFNLFCFACLLLCICNAFMLFPFKLLLQHLFNFWHLLWVSIVAIGIAWVRVAAATAVESLNCIASYFLYLLNTLLLFKRIVLEHLLLYKLQPPVMALANKPTEWKNISKEPKTLPRVVIVSILRFLGVFLFEIFIFHLLSNFRLQYRSAFAVFLSPCSSFVLILYNVLYALLKIKKSCGNIANNNNLCRSF